MKILYVDQTGQLGGGELALLPWLAENSAGACVALFEDGPFRTLLEDRGIAVEVLALNTLKSVRRESGIVPHPACLACIFLSSPIGRTGIRIRNAIRQFAEGISGCGHGEATRTAAGVASA